MLGNAFGIGSLGAAAVQPMLGQGFDRAGARVAIPLGLLALAGALLFLRALGNLEGLPVFLHVTVAYFGIRSFGLGALEQWPNTTLCKWFPENMGTVMGLTNMVAAGILQSVTVLVYSALVKSHGWRETQLIVAAALSVVAITAVLLLAEPPQTTVQGDTNRAAPSHLSGKSSDMSRSGFSVGQAIKTAPFCLLCWISCIFSIDGAGTDFWLQGMVSDAGGTWDLASVFYLTYGLTISVACLAMGPIIDRGVDSRILVCAALLGEMVYVVAITMCAPVAFGFVMGVARGYSYAIWITLQPVLFSRKARPGGPTHCSALGAI